MSLWSWIAEKFNLARPAEEGERVLREVMDIAAETRRERERAMETGNFLAERLVGLNQPRRRVARR